MFRYAIAKATTLTLGLTVLAGSALAQRPPAPNQGPPQFSLERAWNWLMARPGVMIALAIIIVAIGYMIATKKKKSST